jgi:hypothetical protein
MGTTGAALFGGWGGYWVVGGDFDFVEDLHDAVAALEGVIDLEVELGGVFQGDTLCQEVLEDFAFVEEAGDDFLFLFFGADDADVDVAGLEVWGDIGALEGDEGGGEDDFAADDFAEFAADDFVYAL